MHQGDRRHGVAREAGVLEVQLKLLDGQFRIGAGAQVGILFLRCRGREVGPREEPGGFLTGLQHGVDQRLAIDGCRERAAGVDVIERGFLDVEPVE